MRFMSLLVACSLIAASAAAYADSLPMACIGCTVFNDTISPPVLPAGPCVDLATTINAVDPGICEPPTVSVTYPHNEPIPLPTNTQFLPPLPCGPYPQPLPDIHAYTTGMTWPACTRIL